MSGYKNLAEAQIQKIAGKYFSKREEKSSAQDDPVIVFVGAQPGAGKSAAADKVRCELVKQGGYIHVDADRMREEIPIQDCKPTSEETQGDAGKLANALRALAIDGRRNVIEEGTLRGPGIMKHVTERAHKQGYQTELVAVATHEEESLLGIYERFEKQHLNPALNPRFVTEEYHQGALAGFTENLAKDAGGFDRVRVVNRDGQTLFDSAARENRHTGPYEALLKGRELTPERLCSLAQGWERVRTLAEARHAPRDHLEQIGQHRNRVSDLGKARAHIDGMKHLDKNIAALSRDPRYQAHSDGELAKAAYWRGACESAQAALGAPLDMSLFDSRMADRAKVAELPDVAGLDGREITREKPGGRELDEPGREL
ncbi:MAG: zeta toxin family protein [Candidatus Accumulibacter sp.]|nr:zeta toxin family protein [Accumulibacter sp.]